MSVKIPKDGANFGRPPGYQEFKPVPHGPQGPAYYSKSFPKQKEAPKQHR